tara:strand:- start:1699 stop:3516 length:1818 start_codon:yes stop_codon:yes gene_type:complete
MSWEIIFVCALLIGAVVSFVLEKLPVDLTAMAVFGLLLVVSVLTHSAYLPTIEDYLDVFSNPAPLTIAAMFILSTALDKCGAIEVVAQSLGKLAGLGYRPFLFILLLVVAIMSAFINNTAVVVVLLPVVLSLARKTDQAASKFLIPLSYASIFGGCCTAIGTSTNILVSSILQGHDLEPLSMFELSSIGVPLLCGGILYLVFFGKARLPVRDTLTSILSEEERKEYITEAFVKPGSSLIGTSVSESSFFKKRGVRLLEVVRGGVGLQANIRDIVLREGDRLILACRPSAIMEAHAEEGVHFSEEMAMELEQIAAHEGAIVEGVLEPASGIIGQTIGEVNFRQRFRMVLLAVHRRGSNLREKLETVRLEFGDTLLMMGSDAAIENLRSSDDIVLLDRAHLPAKNMRQKTPIVLFVLFGIIFSVSCNIMPIVAAALTGATILFLTGCVRPKDGYRAIEWRILVLIYGMLALGLAMETSGMSSAIARFLVDSSELLVAAQWRPYFILACIYICTGALTEVLSNNATVVLMAPISIGLAVTLGVDPRPFIIATCIASSASFSTPIGYQTNTYVYGVGGYRFSDFFKIGLPLNLYYGLVCVFLIPVIWKF